MNTSLLLIYIFEILGTIMFSISGAMFAIKNKLDLLGIIIIAFTTALGGGIIRDIFIGAIPPRIFFNYQYIVLSFLCSLVVFAIYKLSICYFERRKQILIKLSLVFDAIGLGTFSIVGVNIAIESQYSQNAFIAIFVGFITAVGGGIVRDVLCVEIPSIFKRNEIYATAAILGSGIYYSLYKLNINDTFSSIISIIIVFVVRMVTIKYKLSLPDIKTTT